MAAPEGTHVPIIMSKELKTLLKQYSNLEMMDGKQRIKCSLSGHEMPCQVEAVQSYINGKKFQKLYSKDKYSYEKYKEHIVPSSKKGRGHQLFCLLTLRHLNNIPEHIKKHTEGHKFTRAYAKWKKCQETGEKFQPIVGKRKNYDKELDEESDEDKTGSDVDSLSDLYPVDLKEVEEAADSASDSVSDYDMDEVEEEKESDSVKSDSRKRKKVEGKKKTKKKKT
ncbi:surfeit locus protein 2-like [Ostrea edulis]|uniref:surfeit locus protein 2-like n=1 Tax=Ostrea edulis TaxID=37623 RepID=UPI00209453DA|nr:surfeit locus protein 2-like [Ostrea edulis]